MKARTQTLEAANDVEHDIDKYLDALLHAHKVVYVDHEVDEFTGESGRVMQWRRTKTQATSKHVLSHRLEDTHAVLVMADGQKLRLARL